MAEPLLTSDLEAQFEQERAAWLRRRVLWYCGFSVALSLVAMLIIAAVFLSTQSVSPPVGAEAQVRRDLLRAVTWPVYAGLYGYVFWWAWRKRRSGPALLNTSYWLLVFAAGFSLIMDFALYEVDQATAAAEGSPQGVRAGVFWNASSAVLNVMLWHVVACLFLPWTAREALRPMVPLLLVSALGVLVSSLTVGRLGVGPVVLLCLSPVAAVPGTGVCWLRHSRVRERFMLGVLRRRFRELDQDLTDARRIHESLFPKPQVRSGLRLTFCYEPMRQIGGDYVLARFVKGADGTSERLHVLVLDVMGHGVAAALTVNRLYGELDRLLAEDPRTTPAELLTALNHYVGLTLARQDMYVTALAARVDTAAGELLFASAGHPPAFIRSADGSVERLDPTAAMLGVLDDSEFDIELTQRKLLPGDVFVAYTDGANEARDRSGRMLGLDGVERMLAEGRPAGAAGWCEMLAAAVRQHRAGPPADDTLFVSVERLDRGATAADGRVLAATGAGDRARP